MQMILDALVTLVSLVVIGHYGWSMRGHFSSDGVPGGSKLISVAVVVTLLLFLVLQWQLDQPGASIVAGIVLELLSLWLFWAAIRASRDARLHLAFDADGPRTLVSSGPYRYVRHPFYVSYILFWGGWAIATWSLWSLPSVVVLVAIYVVAARGEERLFANSQMAAEHAEYRRRTGFFWPRLSS